MKSKFEFNEVVVVISTGREGLEKIYGKECVILGKAEREGEALGKWCYTVGFVDEAWFVYEEELESTGKFADPKDLESVGTVKVIVTPDGKGSIKDE
jgi:hypothetical protein